MRFAYLPFALKLLRLQGIEPDVEKYERMFTVRGIYIQVLATIIGGFMLVSLYLNIFS